MTEIPESLPDTPTFASSLEELCEGNNTIESFTSYHSTTANTDTHNEIVSAMSIITTETCYALGLDENNEWIILDECDDYDSIEKTLHAYLGIPTTR